MSKTYKTSFMDGMEFIFVTVFRVYVMQNKTNAHIIRQLQSLRDCNCIRQDIFMQNET